MDFRWEDVKARLEDMANAQKLWLLNEMEQNGGEPDVVGVLFRDCTAESLKGRRCLCYDEEALE